MSEINTDKELIFRFAKFSDAAYLAKLHITCGKNQNGSFMPMLGLKFLTNYYKVLLSSESSVVILAFSTKSKEYLGFHSGSLDASEIRHSINKAKFKLGWTALVSLIFRPTILYQVIKRYLALQNYASDFIIKEGPRGEYWAWKPGALPSYGAVKLHRIWHHIMFILGCKHVRSEVNINHSRVHKAVLAMGGKILSETTDLSNQARIIVEYDLEKFCKRFPVNEN